jgi:hypothetical protein
LARPNAARAPLLEAAEWTRRNADPDALLFDPACYCCFFSKRPRWSPGAEWLKSPGDERLPIRWAVVELDRVYKVAPAEHFVIRRLNQEGRMVAQFPADRAPGKRPAVVILESRGDAPILAKQEDRSALR